LDAFYMHQDVQTMSMDLGKLRIIEGEKVAIE
jgi:hypothetical protein